MAQTASAPWPLAELERLPRAAFVAHLGGVYEHSPWVAERAHARLPFGDFETLVARFREQIGAASLEERRALVLAHPELGERKLEALTLESRREQRGAGLSEADGAEIAQVSALNRAYRERHGFPFIIAVAGLGIEQILTAMRQRLPRDSEIEFAEALAQIERIARLRLRALID